MDRISGGKLGAPRLWGPRVLRRKNKRWFAPQLENLDVWHAKRLKLFKSWLRSGAKHGHNLAGRATLPAATLSAIQFQHTSPSRFSLAHGPSTSDVVLFYGREATRYLAGNVGLHCGRCVAHVSSVIWSLDPQAQPLRWEWIHRAGLRRAQPSLQRTRLSRLLSAFLAPRPGSSIGDEKSTLFLFSR